MIDCRDGLSLGPGLYEVDASQGEFGPEGVKLTRFGDQQFLDELKDDCQLTIVGAGKLMEVKGLVKGFKVGTRCT